MKKIWLLIFILSITSLKANDCIDKAFESFQYKDYNSAITQLKSCESDILNGSSDEDIIKYYYGVGRSYLELDEIDSAFKYQLISYNLKKSLSIEKNLNLSLNDLGIIYNRIGLPHKSIYLLNYAIKLNIKSGNDKLLFYNYLNLGVSYNDMKFRDSTIKYYLLARELLNKVDNFDSSKLYNNIAVFYQDIGDYNNSIKYFNIALKTRTSNQLEQLKWITNLELSYLYQDKLISTKNLIDYYNKAISYDAQYYISDALFKLSQFNISNRELSFDYLKKSINIQTVLKNYVGALSILREHKSYLDTKGIFQTELITLENQLLAFNSNRIAEEYGNEMRINQESELLIEHLENELYYTNIGFYGLLSIILLFFSLITISVFAIKKYKLVNKFITLFRQQNNHLLEGTKATKSELGKLTFMLDKRLDYQGNELLFLTLDKIINDINNFDTIHISSSNKEAECQILQHQRIING